MLALAFMQNVASSISSRSRNRDSFAYHLVAATFSNAIWFISLRTMVSNDMGLALFVPYTIGTVAGSLAGVRISMAIERLIGARSDSHLKG